MRVVDAEPFFLNIHFTGVLEYVQNSPEQKFGIFLVVAISPQSGSRKSMIVRDPV